MIIPTPELVKSGLLSRHLVIKYGHAKKKEELRKQPIPTEEQMESLKFGSDKQHQMWAAYRQARRKTDHNGAMKALCWWLAN